MKYYDKGFIIKDSNHVVLQIYEAGQSILQLFVYKDKVCTSAFKCLNATAFNAQNLSASYRDDFLFNLLGQNKKNIIFRDKKNRILIKINKS